ncbi:FHA domain-containing protein PS1-like [Brassica napus]|uniref:FHA domain-containing protein n=1 Tax=Brassica oleracea var. oleracea TaxID=109376 RepID=A0A0D3DKL2_BRAOL|nr:PREDICTED: FHA domain-containing protein PS1-like [Brassica oleracea var. oleracea]XP_013710132.2 FHA domain-containing protein PS1-like [Brassica napus]
MMAEQQVREKTIPVFTVLKNDAILKNIFVVNSRDFSSPERNGNAEDEVEQILIVGRHPDCDILLTHPSISKYHLQIRSLPSRQKLFVTDLSSVDGTWVRDEKVEADACVEVEEGDVIRIGASTRLYRLHWIPLSHAYDLDNPFVSSTVMEQDEDNRIFEAESQADTASGDDGDGHLDVTSQVLSEDEDTYIDTREFSLPLASPSALTLARDSSIDTQKLQSDEDSQSLAQCALEAAPEKPSKQHSLEDDEWYVRGDGGHVMSEMESSDPETEDVQVSPELAINSVEAKPENPSKEQRPDVHCMSSKSKVNHEPVAPKKKAENSSSQSQSYIDASSTASARNNISMGIHSSSNGKNKMKWTIVLDTSSLLHKESRKPLRLLQGLKGTHLVVPLTVLRELNETKRNWNLLLRRRAEIASSALDWIEECKVNTKWWIQLQSLSEETKATAAPTPPVTPQSNGSTSDDQVLECALLYRNLNIYENLVLLSNDVTLKIKAMAEHVICETPHEFYESLKNPLSERFMWPESLPRGRTWSHFDHVVVREKYNNRTCFPYRKKPTLNGGREESAAAAAKGLKLILLLNSHYGHIH